MGGYMREMRVRGIKQGKMAPDWVLVRMELISENRDYQTVIEDLNQRYVILLNEFLKLGFKQEDIETANYQVDTEYRYEDHQKIFVGYRAHQNLEVAFPFKSKRLNQVMLTLGESKAKPEYQLAFFLKEEEAFRHRLLSGAVEAATQNALVIADQLGVKLGNILEVVYEENQATPYPRAFAMAESQMSLQPKEIERTESVVVTWEIRNLFE
jgi:uncharacterized protein